MRILRILLEKEFRQVFRDPAILRIIFMMPIIQLLIMPLAADYEVRNVKICVVDYDHSSYSRRLVNKITSTEYFTLVDYTDSYSKALSYVEKDEADLVLQIPASFETSSNLIDPGRDAFRHKRFEPPFSPIGPQGTRCPFQRHAFGRSGVGVLL